MNKHILVIADIADNETHTLEKAHDITRTLNATLEIVKFIHCSDQSELSYSAQIEQAKQSLSAIIMRIFTGDTEIVSTVVHDENIADWVTKRCQQNTVDLVIKSRHRTESLFHTPTDWQLIRQLSCPILIATHIKWKTQGNVLLALDLSSDDSKHQQLNSLILSWGKLWSTVNQRQLHAVYSIPIAKPLLELEVVDKDEILQKKSPQAQEKMTALLTQFEMNTLASHITAGPAEKSIPHLAGELHGDLVIMGSIGRKGISGYIHVNTAEKVLHNLRTDCLIIKLGKD